MKLMSFDSKQNTKFLKCIRNHVLNSEKLVELHLIGIFTRIDGWKAISGGVEDSRILKRLLLQNCNLYEKDYLAILFKSLTNSLSCEYIDFKYSNLDDRHTNTVKKLIKKQYESKEDMKWRLGLRNNKKVYTYTVGIKTINLGSNNFTEKFAIEIAHQLSQCDRYLKSLNLRNNKISASGLEKLC
jgi:hypothetical protein